MAIGPLTAEQEGTLWSSLLRVPGMVVQPMTGWLLHSTGMWSDKRALSDQLVRVFGVSSKTWEAGLPKRPKKLQQSLAGLESHVKGTLAELMPESAARKRRAIERSVEAMTDYPTLPPCTLFHQTYGCAGGDRLEALAVALDELSAAVLHNQLPRNELPEGIVQVAVKVGGVRRGQVGSRPEMDPGLDALLLLMAQMDHDLTTPLMANAGEINSLIALLIDVPGATKRRRVQHRLLDIYYALAVAAAGKELPSTLPSIQEAEDALLGGPPESGGQSWVIRWRNGTKALRGEDVQSMIQHVGQVTGKHLGWTMRRLYAAAQAWGRIEETSGLSLAGKRYTQWWDALCNQGRSRTQWVQPYWGRIQPSVQWNGSAQS